MLLLCTFSGCSAWSCSMDLRYSSYNTFQNLGVAFSQTSALEFCGGPKQSRLDWGLDAYWYETWTAQLDIIKYHRKVLWLMWWDIRVLVELREYYKPLNKILFCFRSTMLTCHSFCLVIIYTLVNMNHIVERIAWYRCEIVHVMSTEGS